MRKGRIFILLAALLLGLTVFAFACGKPPDPKPVITLSNTSISNLAVNGQRQLSVTSITPDKYAGAEIVWSSANENIVTVSAFSHDTRALEAYEKAGFKKTCVYRQRLIRGRDKYDEIHMDMLAAEYWAAQREKESAE